MVSVNSKRVRDLALRLYEINAFKFGDFKMKSGLNSPVYFDLRVMVSYPDVMNTVADLIIEYMDENGLSAKHVCGVPYTALPLATLVSVNKDIPMLVRRKEAKAYGTKKLIEGIYSAGDVCLIIEDVVTSGSSVLETFKDLESEGIVVKDAIIVVDREQGGAKNIARSNVKMHSLFNLSFLMNTLHEAGKVSQETVDAVKKYISANQVNSDGKFEVQPQGDVPRTKLTFEKRANLAKCHLSHQLFQVMAQKETNLCLAADLVKCEEILKAADECGPYICLFKTHIDIIEDYNESFIKHLKQLAEKHNFLIMEDRKFADIGNTVSLQYGKGIYKIAEWADLVTVHAVTGPSIVQGLIAGLENKSKNNNSHGIFILAEMSSSGNLINGKYKEETVKMANDAENSNFVAGIVCQSADCFTSPGLIQLTPGVKIEENTGDNLGQQYNSPEYVVKEKGADIAVVGRGILQSKSMGKAAAIYRDRLWAAYKDRIQM